MVDVSPPDLSLHDVALLDMDVRSPEPSVDGDRIDLYRLPVTDLGRYRLVVVPGMADQEFLARHREVIRGYLDGGGVLLFGGHLHRDWLPGASRFVPLHPPSLASYRVAEIAPHPIFDGVGPDDLTFRRGVAGFFARGHHPPPPGAQVLVRLAGGEPATYVDQVSTAGTIVVHTTADLFTHGEPGTPAARVPGQLVAWARAQGRRDGGASAPVAAPADGPPGTGTGHGLAAVHSGSAPHHRALTTPQYARHLTGGLLYLPDLARTDLTGYDAVVLPERMHRGLLTAAAPRLHELLDAGGTIVAFAGGEPLPEFLPGVRFDPRPTNFWWWLEPGAGLGLRTPSPEHPLFEHLSLRDCTWHYHGALTPPAGAQTLVALPSGEALLYVDRVSTPGTLVVSTLDPLTHFGGHFMPATERFLDGFLPWLGGAVVRSAR
ncbi:hypothetical protein GCM10010210_40200 [Pseudonocardia hydrocarbonoxydans]|uniref:Uncharacterized protein n=2 Tax=Pseudonocardia hydrocarbonoxydans TaxID=76726 RepID=A0A4Y3WS77_9PSEU|nr:hypothetical protein PHY01_40100 [Pseudonocardia hydrocarbonoxydans]